MIRALFIATLSFVCASAVHASSFAFDDVVSSRDNLFFNDWGHWYTQPIDAALNAEGSSAARAAQSGGSSFNFAGFDTLQITATGAIAAHGNVQTGPDGCNSPDCELHDGNFRLLPMYSLIGIWSSSATEITPFGAWNDIGSGLGLLFIGSFATLSIPDFPAAYLFLAANDGAFADNNGQFNLHFLASAVPEPGTMALLCAALISLVLVFQLRHRAS